MSSGSEPTHPAGGGPVFTPGTVNRLQKKLDRLGRIRQFRSLLQAGLTQVDAASRIGISRSTATTWNTEPTTPSVEEIIERAAVDGTPRSELVTQLSGIQWLLHGYWDWEAEFNASWMQLRNAVDDGLLATDEYAAVCDSMEVITRKVLNRPPCDPRTCDAHEEHLYVLCFGEPTVVKSRDICAWDRIEYHREFDRRHLTYPLTHYVGWTGQQPPIKRVYDHGRGSSAAVAKTIPGTAYEESVLKAFGRCPKCGNSLDYFSESPWRDHFNPLTFLAECREQEAARQAGERRAEEDRAAKAELREWMKANRPKPW